MERGRQKAIYIIAVTAGQATQSQLQQTKIHEWTPTSGNNTAFGGFGWPAKHSVHRRQSWAKVIEEVEIDTRL